MWDSNPYYNPEKFDLTPIAELEMYEPNYSFDTVVVWKHNENGLLYWAHDSGCSCPSPFEEYTSLEQLSVLVSTDYDMLRRYVSESYDAAARQSFLRKVRAELRKFG